MGLQSSPLCLLSRDTALWATHPNTLAVNTNRDINSSSFFFFSYKIMFSHQISWDARDECYFPYSDSFTKLPHYIHKKTRFGLIKTHAYC